MTSTPASRSARAMILAPRSCPSRPGLAIRMRSRRSATRASDPCRIAVHAEHVAEDVRDLAHGALRLYGGDHRRHQVGALRGGGVDVGEAVLHRTGGPRALALAHARCL